MSTVLFRLVFLTNNSKIQKQEIIFIISSTKMVEWKLLKNQLWKIMHLLQCLLGHQLDLHILGMPLLLQLQQKIVQ